VVTATLESGRTRIHIEEKYSLTDWRLFAPGWGAAAGALLSAGLAALAGVANGPEILLVVLPGAVAGGILTANTIIRTMVNRRRPQLEELADRLAVQVERRAVREGEARPLSEGG
jgi:hypothetical protein